MKTYNKRVFFQDLGLIPYREAWDYQESLFDRIVSQKQKNRSKNEAMPTDNYLLFCEHPHVYTLGKSGKDSNLLINEEFLKSKGASLFRINRGGDITYHGPGQLVAYPILDLDNFKISIKDYIAMLEEVVIATLSEFGISAGRLEGATGVWLDPDNNVRARKICAIGVRTSHWVSMHGFALNLSTDLSFFEYIVPCGIAGKSVTSLETESGSRVDVDKVKVKLLNNFGGVFGMEITSEDDHGSFQHRFQDGN